MERPKRTNTWRGVPDAVNGKMKELCETRGEEWVAKTKPELCKDEEDAKRLCKAYRMALDMSSSGLDDQGQIILTPEQWRHLSSSCVVSSE